MKIRPTAKHSHSRFRASRSHCCQPSLYDNSTFSTANYRLLQMLVNNFKHNEKSTEDKIRHIGRFGSSRAHSLQLNAVEARSIRSQEIAYPWMMKRRRTKSTFPSNFDFHSFQRPQDVADAAMRCCLYSSTTTAKKALISLFMPST